MDALNKPNLLHLEDFSNQGAFRNVKNPEIDVILYQKVSVTLPNLLKRNEKEWKAIIFIVLRNMPW